MLSWELTRESTIVGTGRSELRCNRAESREDVGIVVLVVAFAHFLEVKGALWCVPLAFGRILLFALLVAFWPPSLFQVQSLSAKRSLFSGCWD